MKTEIIETKKERPKSVAEQLAEFIPSKELPEEFSEYPSLKTSFLAMIDTDFNTENLRKNTYHFREILNAYPVTFPEKWDTDFKQLREIKDPIKQLERATLCRKKLYDMFFLEDNSLHPEIEAAFGKENVKKFYQKHGKEALENLLLYCHWDRCVEDWSIKLCLEDIENNLKKKLNSAQEELRAQKQLQARNQKTDNVRNLIWQVSPYVEKLRDLHDTLLNAVSTGYLENDKTKQLSQISQDIKTELNSNTDRNGFGTTNRTINTFENQIVDIISENELLKLDFLARLISILIHLGTIFIDKNPLKPYLKILNWQPTEIDLSVATNLLTLAQKKIELLKKQSLDWTITSLPTRTIIPPSMPNEIAAAQKALETLKKLPELTN